MTSTSGRDDLSPFAAPWLDLTRLQNVSKPEVDPNGLTRAHVDRTENRKPLSENAFPTKGVHRREVSHSRTVSFRGTLLVSPMHLAEIARPKSGESVERVQDYLEAVGSRWTILNWSREEVSKREALGYREPWLHEGWSRMARSSYGPNLRPFIRRMREPWAQTMLDDWEKEAQDVMKGG